LKAINLLLEQSVVGLDLSDLVFWVIFNRKSECRNEGNKQKKNPANLLAGLSSPSGGVFVIGYQLFILTP